jgi:type I restriction-modification system DNA methylase subunit
LQVVNSAFLRALEALSVLLKKVFLITMPALPPALSILIKCCKNKLAVFLLQKNTFYGKEKKSLAYIIGIMNMILHGVEAPNIIHTNTLAENLADIQEKDRYDIILANNDVWGFNAVQNHIHNANDIRQRFFFFAVKGIFL